MNPIYSVAPDPEDLESNNASSTPAKKQNEPKEKILPSSSSSSDTLSAEDGNNKPVRQKKKKKKKVPGSCSSNLGNVSSSNSSNLRSAQNNGNSCTQISTKYVVSTTNNPSTNINTSTVSVSNTQNISSTNLNPQKNKINHSAHENHNAAELTNKNFATEKSLTSNYGAVSNNPNPAPTTETTIDELKERQLKELKKNRENRALRKWAYERARNRGIMGVFIAFFSGLTTLHYLTLLYVGVRHELLKINSAAEELDNVDSFVNNIISGAQKPDAPMKTARRDLHDFENGILYSYRNSGFGAFMCIFPGFLALVVAGLLQKEGWGKLPSGLFEIFGDDWYFGKQKEGRTNWCLQNYGCLCFPMPEFESDIEYQLV